MSQQGKRDRLTIMQKFNRGFTLIELMIVVAIVAILAAIAFPSYARYVEQARRADAKSALMDAAQRMERCYTQNNTYIGCTVPAASPDGYYTIALGGAVNPTTATFFRLSATRVAGGAQAGDTRCGDYWLDSTGDRGVNNASRTRDECW